MLAVTGFTSGRFDRTCLAMRLLRILCTLCRLCFRNCSRWASDIVKVAQPNQRLAELHLWSCIAVCLEWSSPEAIVLRLENRKQNEAYRRIYCDIAQFSHMPVCPGALPASACRSLGSRAVR